MKNRMLCLALGILLVSLFSPNVFSQVTVVRVMPSSQKSPAVGEKPTVNVGIENGQNVAGYQVWLEFDPTALRFSNAKVTLGAGGYFPEGTFVGVPKIRGLLLRQRVGLTATSSPSESNGDGPLASFVFEVLDTKASSLTLVAGTSSTDSGTLLSNKDGTLSFPRLENGKVIGTEQQSKVANTGDPVQRVFYHPLFDSRIVLDISDTKDAKIEMPDDTISFVAFGKDVTYFLLTTRYPDRGENVRHKFMITTLHLPDGTEWVSAVIPPRKSKGYKAAEAGIKFVWTLLGEIPGVSLIQASLGLYEDIADFLYTPENPEFYLGARKDNLSPLEDVYTALNHIVLLDKTITHLEFTVEEVYTIFTPGSVEKLYYVKNKFEWTLQEGVPAAPAIHPITLADYPPFQLMPPEAQQKLLELSELMSNGRSSAFANAEAWQIPEETALLSNYPNPFNPETWLPYQLAEPAEVTLTIYDINGRVVRDLDLGHQRAGMYHSRSRAAYWDGRNAQGEPVASGVYFYTLSAGDFSATRKMLIRK